MAVCKCNDANTWAGAGCDTSATVMAARVSAREAVASALVAAVAVVRVGVCCSVFVLFVCVCFFFCEGENGRSWWDNVAGCVRASAALLSCCVLVVCLLCACCVLVVCVCVCMCVCARLADTESPHVCGSFGFACGAGSGVFCTG